MAATPEKAEQLAKKAQASWVTIYTLRQSPLGQIGVTLVHQGEPVPTNSFPFQRGILTNATQIAQLLQESAAKNFTLSSDQRAFRNQALSKLKENQQNH